jgi:hypothetical protein
VKLYAPTGLSPTRRTAGRSGPPGEGRRSDGGERSRGSPTSLPRAAAARGRRSGVRGRTRCARRAAGRRRALRDYRPIAASARAAWMRAALVSAERPRPPPRQPHPSASTRLGQLSLSSSRSPQALHDTSLTGLPNRSSSPGRSTARCSTPTRHCRHRRAPRRPRPSKEVNAARTTRRRRPLRGRSAIIAARAEGGHGRPARRRRVRDRGSETGSAAAVELAHRVRDGLSGHSVEGLQLRSTRASASRRALTGLDGGTLLRHAPTRSTSQGRPPAVRLLRDARPLLALTPRPDRRLRRAIARDELVLHCQPLAEIGSGRGRLRRALVRWQHRARPARSGTIHAAHEHRASSAICAGSSPGAPSAGSRTGGPAAMTSQSR